MPLMNQNVDRQCFLRTGRQQLARTRKGRPAGRDVLGQLREHAADRASDRRTDGRAGREGREGDGARAGWRERVCEDTELRGQRASAGSASRMEWSYRGGDGRGRAEPLKSTENVDRDLG